MPGRLAHRLISSVRALPTGGTMRRHPLLVAFGLLAVLVPLMPAGSAQASTGGFCRETGTHHAQGPGATMTPRHVEFTLSTKLGPCQLPDPSIVSGTMVSSESGTFTCAGGIPGTLAPVPFTILWS